MQQSLANHDAQKVMQPTTGCAGPLEEDSRINTFNRFVLLEMDREQQIDNVVPCQNDVNAKEKAESNLSSIREDLNGTEPFSILNKPIAFRHKSIVLCYGIY